MPEPAKTDAVYDVIGFFRTLLERTDTSLLEEWESLLDPSASRTGAGAPRCTSWSRPSGCAS